MRRVCHDFFACTIFKSVISGLSLFWADKSGFHYFKIVWCQWWVPFSVYSCYRGTPIYRGRIGKQQRLVSTSEETSRSSQSFNNKFASLLDSEITLSKFDIK